MRSIIFTVLLGICLATGFRLSIPSKYKLGDVNFATVPKLEVGERLKNYKPGVDKAYPFELGAGHYYQFDIMLRPDQREERGARNAIALTSSNADVRWPDAVVPYVITGTFTDAEKASIATAIEQFTKNTCVKFVPKSNEAVFLTINNGASGCWSYVGRSLDNNYNLANLHTPNCLANTGTIAHELMHVLGFYHEAIRPDRDDWISVNMSALYPKYQTTSYFDANFAKLTAAQTELYGKPYNYGSVMHYSKWAGAASYDAPVLINLKPWTGDFGSPAGLTAPDIQQINYMYCNSTTG